MIFVADDVAENAWMDAAENFKRGTYDIEGGPNVTVTATVPVLWVRKSMGQMLQNGAILKADIIISKFQYPSVNVVGVIPGTDPKLKSEYLLLEQPILMHMGCAILLMAIPFIMALMIMPVLQQQCLPRRAHM